MGRYVRTIPLCQHTRLYGIVTEEDTHLYNSRSVFQFWIRSELGIKIVDKGSSSSDCTGVVGWLRNASPCVGKLLDVVGGRFFWDSRCVISREVAIEFFGECRVFCAPHFILKRSEDTSGSFLNAQTNYFVFWLFEFFFFFVPTLTRFVNVANNFDSINSERGVLHLV